MISTPRCFNLRECPAAESRRQIFNEASANGADIPNDPLSVHIAHGLAYTIGSAIGSTPPSDDACLAAFIAPNAAGLTAGARAWSKHAHRSGSAQEAGWWGAPRGSVASINACARALFDRVVPAATWRNLHWLPHEVLVYEVRVPEGYGMRWSRDLSGVVEDSGRVKEGMQEEADDIERHPWVFRGFVEPMIENGHELGWRH